MRLDPPSTLGSRAFKRAPYQPTLVVLLGVIVAACSCTNVGCGSDLRFRVDDLAPFVSASPFGLEVCLEDVCSSYEFDALPVGDFLMLPSGSVTPGVMQVKLTIRSSTTHVSEGTIELSRFRPNGDDCAPVCAVADIVVDGDALVNAEPGAFGERE